jgi:hypothetical protein
MFCEELEDFIHFLIWRCDEIQNLLTYVIASKEWLLIQGDIKTSKK